MYAVMGITGRVGGAVASTLLAGGHAVRGVVRDPARAAGWAARGVTLVTADQADPAALAAALAGVDGAFVMLPPMFAPSADFAEARQWIAALRSALVTAAPPRVVALSSVGAQHDRGLGVITPLHLMEAALGTLPVPVAFVRAGWFMENASVDVQPAFDAGRLASYLQPVDRPVPMVSTADVGRVAAETLAQTPAGTWAGRRVIELEGPKRYAPLDVAAALSVLVRRPVRTVAVPRAEWAAAFGPSGAARIEMLDGFDAGHVDFAGGPDVEHVRGRVTLDEAVARLASA